VRASGPNAGWPEPKIRTVLPKLLDQHRLVGRKLGRRKADDAWVLKMNQTINKSTQEQAADAVAAALAEGMDPEAVGEAISLAANQLVLRSTSSRTHGNSLGVHGCDATNAWRNIARVTDQRTRGVIVLEPNSDSRRRSAFFALRTINLGCAIPWPA